jgi:hypothetical protein
MGSQRVAARFLPKEQTRIGRNPLFMRVFSGDPSRSNITSKIKGLDWQTGLSAPIEVKSVSAALANQVQTLSEAGRALHNIINASSDMHHLDEAARRLWRGNVEGWISDSEGRRTFPTQSNAGAP